MTSILQELIDTFGAERVRENEPMSAHTTFKIGGPAEFYLSADTTNDLIKSVQIANKLGIPLFVLGGGSNIIVSDRGIEGLVVKNNCRKFDIVSIKGKIEKQQMGIKEALVEAESGTIMNQLVRFTIEKGFSGLEYQLGLPGTVGGAIFMNSNFPLKSAYVGDPVVRATLLTRDGEIKEVEKSYFRFAYDVSILQETHEIVLSIIFRFLPETVEVLWGRANEALTHRSSTQPKGASAGCTYRNISIVDAMHAATPNNITSAGFLIDKAGLKGKRVGDAVISDQHANFVLNMGNATASDVTELLRIAKEEVKKRFGVTLHLEVRYVGRI